MTREEIITVKVGDTIFYEGDPVEVVHIDEVRISFNSVNEDWSCGNIPIYERRPGNSKTNLELLSK